MRGTVIPRVRGFLIVTSLTAMPSRALSQNPSVRPADIDPAMISWIDSLVTSELRRTGAPGAQLTILKGSTVLQRAYGVVEHRSARRTTRETVFPIGSITKSFTAAAVLLEVRAGRLSLDREVATLWPDRAFDRRVVVRQLLNHTSGIRSYESLIPDVGAFARRAVRPDTVLSFVSGVALQFDPGSRWSYSNTGYHLLGLAVERASTLSYFAYVEQRLTLPHGLAATHACRTGGAEGQAVGHEIEAQGIERATLPNVNFSFAAGALCSTASDIARWLRLLPAVLGTESYAMMRTPATLADGQRHPYGFGLLLGDLGGHAYFGHGGSLPGFDGFAAHYPNDSLTIALFVNLRPFDTESLQQKIARKLLGVPEVSLVDLPVAAPERRKFVGTYTIDGRSLRITDSDTHLRLVGPGDFTLLHQGDLVFVAREETSVQVRFVVEDGAVRGMIFTAPGRRFELRRAP